MHYTGPIYRPPFESRSLLLQVTVGCSHNACSFCTMYRDTPFRMEPLEQIREDLEEAKLHYPQAQRVFLENGDPFVLSAGRLREIAELIHKTLPRVQNISMYASIGNIRGKTNEELRMLRGLGINELNVGVESGLDRALREMNKGYTAREAEHQLLRLRDAGMDYGANIIFGSAGAEYRLENARETARLMNATEPYLIFTGTIHADPGCPLHDRLIRGTFRENTVEEYFQEEELFLRELTLENCFLFGLHPSNVAGLYGNLGRDREKLLEALVRRRASLPETLRSAPPRRGEEGAVLL